MHYCGRGQFFVRRINVYAERFETGKDIGNHIVLNIVRQVQYILYGQ